ncbi:CoA transferase [Paraburkholderia sediminicola]|uniref:CoA transferase n=1 Tax=Paraburkholderia sediminicola TaxID=458836 RepID=UPI0010D6DA73
MPVTIPCYPQCIHDADVFIQSFRPGVCERRGLGPKDLARIRPRIIYVSVSCYGDGGPWATRGGYEPLSQTANGLAVDEGSYEHPRFAPTRTLNDLLAAYLAATGALGALIRRAREGGSYHAKASLTGASMWVQKLERLRDDEWRNISGDLTPLPVDLMRTQSGFGELKHAAPIVRFSETPAFWDKPPTCLWRGFFALARQKVIQSRRRLGYPGDFGPALSNSGTSHIVLRQSV